MGAHLSSSNRQGQRGRQRLNSDINVTPFVDVMLVLLIIFMVTAPMIVSGVDVQLPEASSSPIPNQEEPLVVTVDKQGKIYIQETQVDSRTLIAKLRAITRQKMDSIIYVRGDRNVTYGQVMKLFDSIHSGGFSKVTLLIDMPRQTTTNTEG